MSSEPVVPPPPGWYDPGTNSGELRYWDGGQWTDDTAAATEVAAGPVPVGRKPRGVMLRALLTLLLWIGIWWSGAQVALIPGASMASDSGSGLTALYVLVVYGALGRLVSYRRRDCFFVLIPFWNIFWTLRIAWRIAFLPCRDWKPRPDELKDLVPVPHAGSRVYVRR
ncbi:Protein of unknown function [Actinopolymorpha cephalotaxi]|uniref:DUF2510 domain-containing protein n=1 Tax=Actinopolymorpha cephalotaxi TaxID=504797 RepID=A0A1I2X977_9ACTN|nr:DUF2510 domain-containing protein [Actinopolymorpha cephalotaxi]NYH86127.1 hypothetical protein [Actinopolymorpha cephalotaxi]SFH10058.1 Protein of unknown function [Actinopolymorpha cephalotaxi]